MGVDLLVLGGLTRLGRLLPEFARARLFLLALPVLRVAISVPRLVVFVAIMRSVKKNFMINKIRKNTG